MPQILVLVLADCVRGVALLDSVCCAEPTRKLVARQTPRLASSWPLALPDQPTQRRGSCTVVPVLCVSRFASFNHHALSDFPSSRLDMTSRLNMEITGGHPYHIMLCAACFWTFAPQLQTCVDAFRTELRAAQQTLLTL